MKNFEWNGYLDEIPNYKIFIDCIFKTRDIFIETFGISIMSKVELFLDNATQDSGYTPTITPIFNKYLIIKLGISDFSKNELIVYQFSHELCHYVFYSLAGLDKEAADSEEENICSAMSLIVLNLLFPENIGFWISYVSNLDNSNYNKGVKIANECNFDINYLTEKIMKVCKNKELIKG